MATILGVSEMTVRRDLDELIGPSGSGGSVRPFSVDESYNLLKAAQKAHSQKERIGKFAASMVALNDVITIDTGSTTVKMIPFIPEEFYLTVVCYTANALMGLLNRQGIRLFMCGGIYHENTELFECPESIQFIKRTRINKAFLSAAGVHENLGITCANSFEVPLKDAILKSSSEKILLADSSKFGQTRLSYFCELDEIDAVVTDTDLPEEWRKRIVSKGIALHLV